jgi:hypothetical protein
MGILTRGHRVVFEPEAYAFERASTGTYEELRRKVRIATRSVSASLYLREAILGLSAINLLKFFSHRVMRYLSFYMILGAFLTNLFLLLEWGGTFYWCLMGVQVAFYGIGLAGIALMDRKPVGILKVVRLISYFLAANAAACYGATRAVIGARIKFWESPKSAR